MNELTDSQLVALCEKTMSASETSMVENHLLDCEACRRRFAEISCTIESIRGAFAGVEGEISPEMDMAAHSHMRVACRRQRQRRLRVAVAAAGLVVSAAAVLAFYTIPALLSENVTRPLPQAVHIPVIVPTEKKPDNLVVDRPNFKDRRTIEVPNDGGGRKDVAKPAAAAAPSGHLLGDVNDDGVVDVLDIQLLQKIIVTESDTLYIPRADVTGDGNIDVCDVQTLMRSILR
jgi:hypothetical protein